MAPLPVGQGSKEPARGGVLGVSSATSFFLEFPLVPVPENRENLLLVETWGRLMLKLYGWIFFFEIGGGGGHTLAPSLRASGGLGACLVHAA